MNIALYRVFINNDNWMEKVVDDFRWICTSGLFKKCDKLYIDVPEVKANELLSGEEWIKFFWGRVDDKKVEIQTHLKYNESDVSTWISHYPNDKIIYVSSNGILDS